MFFIKIKVNGYLKNITDNTKEIISVSAIKNKNKISYILNETKHKITIYDDKIVLVRENDEFVHSLIYSIDNFTKSEYYIKELNTNIEIKIKTNKIELDEKHIKIDYEIVDSGDKYSYRIDLE